MDNVRNKRPIAFDLRVNDLNSNTIDCCKTLELLARWIPVCKDIADECGLDLPDADRLRLMILSAHKTMCILADVCLVFPDPITQDRIVTQFLIDCFMGGRCDFGTR